MKKLFALAAILALACTDGPTANTASLDPTFPRDSAAAVAHGGFWPAALVARATVRHPVTAYSLDCTGALTTVTEAPYQMTLDVSQGLTQTLYASVWRDDPNTPGWQTYYCQDTAPNVTWEPFSNWQNWITVVNQTDQTITLKGKAATNIYAQWGAHVTVQPSVHDSTPSFVKTVP